MTDSFFFTAPGGREHNEDAVGQREIPGGTLFLLADGLGGHHRGAEASAQVIASMQEAAPPQDGEDLEQWLICAITQANDVLLQLQADSGSNMRSTLVALALTEDKAVWGHVGDSRLYCIREGRLLSYTNDHSVAYAKYKCGEITKTKPLCCVPWATPPGAIRIWKLWTARPSQVMVFCCARMACGNTSTMGRSWLIFASLPALRTGLVFFCCG